MMAAMPGRDDQPITVPPPDGEDDAYNATTKVGAMPEEMMAKLRAEGLLPPVVDEPAAAPPPKSRPFVDPTPVRDDGPIAVIHSSTPPDDDASPVSAQIPSAPRAPTLAVDDAPAVVSAPPPDVALEAPTVGPRFRRSQIVIGIVAALGALVAFAFLMALMSHRR
jgi:hypothetical protein